LLQGQLHFHEPIDHREHNLVDSAGTMNFVPERTAPQTWNSSRLIRPSASPPLLVSDLRSAVSTWREWSG